MTIALSIVIPAYNEERTAAAVIADHRAVAAAIAPSFEILVCDDGSTDGTAAELATAYLTTPELAVITNDQNAGIPATMKRLYGLARGEWIYFAPADGQVPAEGLRRMWAVRDGAALVVGRRVPRRDPLARILMAEVYSAVIRTAFRLPVRDIDSVKLYRAADLRTVMIQSASNFFEAEILIALHRSGRVVREIVIEHRPRIAGRAKGVTPRGAALALYELSSFMIRDRVRGWSR